MQYPAGKEVVLNASAIAIKKKGVLIIGPSGAGKSTLAIDMLSLGATLIADDQTVLMAKPDGLYMKPLPNNTGLIEARFVGIIKIPWQNSAKLSMVVDLAREEKDRLPPFRTYEILNHKFPCIYAKGNAFVGKALYVLLAGERLH